MGNTLFEIDLLTDLEPGIPGGGTPAATDAEVHGKKYREHEFPSHTEGGIEHARLPPVSTPSP